MAGEASLRVWDWTLRLFHWSIVILVVAMWWTAEQGHMDWHKWLGLVFVGVLVYRLVWGVIGPQTARFSGLLPRPRKLFDYAKSLFERPYKQGVGHNPLGALSVLALLSALALQVGSGLFAVDVNGLYSGWLGRFVSFDVGRAFSDFHETVFNVLLALIALHVIAIALYHFVFRANLVGPMLTGYQRGAARPETHTPVEASPIRVLIAVACAGLSAGLIYAFGG